ncbi:MAG TPA: hypothetical protein V6C81_31735 [Planktothrix sp.]
MINRAIVMSEAVLASRLRQFPNLVQHHVVVCITEPGQPFLNIEGENVLRLTFHDLDPQLLGDGDKSCLRRYTVFSEALADHVVRFLIERNQKTGKAQILVVQCQAGIARSGAVARFAVELFKLNQDEFKADNPNIEPNKHVLALLRRSAGLPQPNPESE